MKQTAVQWLEECIKIGLTYEQEVSFEGLFQQALEMEKEQIIQAITKTIVGSNIIYDKEYPEVTYTAEQYYKETYETKTN